MLHLASNMRQMGHLARGVYTAATGPFGGHASLATGLIACWECNETSGTTMIDSHTGGYDGSISGATINQSGIIDKCYSYDGSNDVTTVADDAVWDVGGALTICMWLKYTEGRNGGRVFIIHDLSAYKYMIYRYSNNTNLGFYVTTASGASSANAGSYAADGNWHHVVCVYDRTLATKRLKVYIDTVERASATGYDEDIVDGDEGIIFGRISTNYLTFSKDQTLIYNRALTTSEISDLYNSGAGLAY